MGASALNIAVRQISLALRTKGLLGTSLIDIAPLKKGKEEVLRYPSMVGGTGSSE
jgi:hypothetical protein